LRISSLRLAIPGIVAAALIGAAPARAEDSEPILVEMFVSQACKASPAAAQYAVELGKRGDLVTLVWHIDYWNILSNRKHGRWRDPYGETAFSARQRIYNRKIRGRTTVFTPQAIVGGAGSEKGWDRKGVEKLIDLEKEERRLARTSIARKGERLAATVDPSGSEFMEVFLVSFRDWSATDITGGENAGVRFEEPHVVASVAKIGDVTYKTETFEFAAPAEGTGCALVVQERGQGRVRAARYCP